MQEKKFVLLICSLLLDDNVLRWYKVEKMFLVIYIIHVVKLIKFEVRRCFF